MHDSLNLTIEARSPSSNFRRRLSVSRRKQLLLSLGIVAVALLTYLWLFGIQTFFLLEAHNAARQLPFIKQTPIGPTDLSVSQMPGMKLSYFGYEFESPWTDIDNEKTKIAGGNKVLYYISFWNVFMLWSAPPHEFMNGVLTQMKIDRTRFRKIYGDGVLDSDYGFTRLILDTTPSRVSIFATRELDASQEMLLIVKAISIPGNPQSGIFEVEGKEVQTCAPG